MVTLKDVSQIEKEIQEMYQHLHKIPELGFNEKETSRYIQSKLLEWGIETVSGVARTGVIGNIHGKNPGKKVALRADMDALPITEETGLPYSSTIPGKMHACGHDAHVSMLLGVARYFSQHPEKLQGSVRFIFQPAEEDKDPDVPALGEESGGAYYIIQEGYLKDVDYCLAIHVDPSLPVGQMKVFEKEAMATTDLFRVIIKGKGGHGGAPHKARDIIPPLTEILSALNTVIPREVNPFSPAVLSIGTVHTPSSVWNAIPGKAEISGTVRTYSEEVRNHINHRIQEIAGTIAKAHGSTARYEREKGYPCTVNDSRVAAMVVEAGEAFLGKGNVIADPEPLTGGEDVGRYFEQVPGAMMFLGCRDPESSTYSDLHSPDFKVDLKTLAHGTCIHINNVMKLQEEA